MASKDKDKKKEDKKKDDKKKDDKKKDDKKKKDGKVEEDLLAADFDKNDFPFNRLKHFPSMSQKEGKLKYRSGTGSWVDRYVVLHCNYLIYFEPSTDRMGGGIPRDAAKPLGALRLEQIKWEGIEVLDKEIISGGLIPKVVNYPAALTIPLNQEGKKITLQFDTTIEMEAWQKLLIKQSRNVAEWKPIMAKDSPISLIEEMYQKYPPNPHWLHGPVKGQEEQWLTQLKDYHDTRQKHLKMFKRAQLFAEYYNAKNKQYVDWFVMSGGEGKASMERDLVQMEDKFINIWKKEAQHGLTTIEKEIAEVKPDEVDKLHEKVTWRKKEVELWTSYQREVSNRTDDPLAGERVQWAKHFATTSKMMEDFEARKKELAEQKKKEAEAEFFRQQAEIRRLEEERRNDPFSDLNIKDDSDPFADMKVETV